jgi:hypothetical protein
MRTGVCQTQSKVVRVVVALQRQQNAQIEGQCKEVSDITMRSRNIAISH